MHQPTVVVCTRLDVVCLFRFDDSEQQVVAVVAAAVADVVVPVVGVTAIVVVAVVFAVGVQFAAERCLSTATGYLQVS